MIKLRQFAKNLPAVIWISTYDLQKIIYVNAAYEKIWGRRVKSLYENPLSWLESVHVDDQAIVHHHFGVAINQQKSVTIEYRIVRPDGEVRWIYDHGFLIKNAKNEPYHKAGIAYDITSRKESETLARQYQTELSRLSRIHSMNEVASMLAHELNQPLTALNTYISGCILRLEGGGAQQNEILEVMKKAAKNAELAGTLIHRMKNFVRRGELFYEQVNINDIVKETVSLFHYEMYCASILFEFDFSENLPSIVIDKIQIQQVLLNLLRNSIDAVAEINLAKPRIILKTQMLNSDYISVSVCDNGSGITPENIGSIFKPYFTTKSGGKNMGMGLAICFSIIETHGGKISAHKLSQGGICIEFSLPVNQIKYKK